MAPLFTAQKATWASCWHFPRPLATRGDFTQDHAAGSRWMQAVQWASIKAGDHWAWGSHAFREPGKQASSLSRGRHYPDPQGGLQQIQPWKLVCIKNSQGLAFLAYPGEVIPLNNFPRWIWGGTSQIPSLLQVNQDGRGFPGSGSVTSTFSAHSPPSPQPWLLIWYAQARGCWNLWGPDTAGHHAKPSVCLISLNPHTFWKSVTPPCLSLTDKEIEVQRR